MSMEREAMRPLAVMVKPVGSACNMRCAYCYYLGASGSSPVGRMPLHVLERLVRDYIEAAEGTIPDLENIKLSLVCAGAEGLETVPMNIHQGLKVTKATAILNGGIVFFGDENNNEGNDDE